MDEETKIELSLNPEFVDAKQFLQGVEAFVGLMKEVGGVVSAGGPKLKWLVKVREGSNIVGVYPSGEAARDSGRLCINAIEAGLRELEKSAERPRHFTDDALKKVRALSDIVGTHGGRVEIVQVIGINDSTRLTHQSFANVEKILGGYLVSFGSVEGRLRLISDIRGSHIAIEDAITHKTVRCSLNSDDMEDIAQVFGHRVSVYGLVKYRKDGEIVSVQAHDYRVLRDNKDLPAADDVRGILKDLH